MIRFLVVLALLSGCRATPPDTISHTRKADDDVRDLVRRADRAIAATAVNDYSLPLSSTRRSPIYEATELYGRACLLGHIQACWKRLAIRIGPGRPRSPTIDPRFVETVKRHCEAGDVLSCRAVQGYQLPGQRLGSIGGDRSCLGDDSRCDRVGLRRECLAGITVSCSILAALEYTKPVQQRRWLLRAHRLADEGCKLGIASDCGTRAPNGDDDLARLSLSCHFDSEACIGAAIIQEKAGKVLDVRDLLERGCQMDEPTICVYVALKYRDGTLPEPVPGRAHALLKLMCPRYRLGIENDHCDGYTTAGEQP